MPRLTPPVVASGTIRALSQPELVVEELLIRPWQDGDAPAVVEAYADPEIQRWHGRVMDEAEALAWVRSWPEAWAGESRASWAVVAHGALVGRIGVNRLDLDAGLAEAAYWVLPTARGAGIASRALVTMTRWFFDVVGLHRVELEHSTANVASCRVAVRAGFLGEGIKRQSILHADGWHDMHLHARLD